jgi:hypothetical protein
VLEDQALRLTGGTYFLGDVGIGSALFVRDDYCGMRDVVLELVASGMRKLVISGNPGIGKSWFGYFFLHHLAVTQPRSRIVWESVREGRRYMFHESSVLQGDRTSFRDVLDDRDAWCVWCV